METLRERATAAWLFLVIINVGDLLLYIESLKWADVNEAWVMAVLSPDEVILIKLLMPVVVAGILQVKPTEKIVRVLWYLCALYALVTVWNVLQFIL